MKTRYLLAAVMSILSLSPARAEDIVDEDDMLPVGTSVKEATVSDPPAIPASPKTPAQVSEEKYTIDEIARSMAIAAKLADKTQTVRSKDDPKTTPSSLPKEFNETSGYSFGNNPSIYPESAYKKRKGNSGYISGSLNYSYFDILGNNMGYDIERAGGFALGFYPGDTAPVRVEIEYMNYTASWDETVSYSHSVLNSPPTTETTEASDIVNLRGIAFNAYLFAPWNSWFKPYIGVGLGHARLRRDITAYVVGEEKFAETLRSGTSNVTQMMMGFDIYLGDSNLAIGTEYKVTGGDFSGRGFGTDIQSTNIKTLAFKIRADF